MCDGQLNLGEWKEKLVGKTYVKDGSGGDNTFTDSDLHQPHRIIGPNTPTSRDFKPYRLNVIVDDNNVCTDVKAF